jgi:hypothetical protein
MAVDRADTGAEAVEQQRAVDTPPPPPPDRPGAEGFPSRAESRAAAAAPDTDQRQQPDQAADAPAAQDADGSPIREDVDSPDKTDNDQPGDRAPDGHDEGDEQTPASPADRHRSDDALAPARDDPRTAEADSDVPERRLDQGEPRLTPPPADEHPEPAHIPAEPIEQPADIPAGEAAEQRPHDESPSPDQSQPEEVPFPADDRTEDSAAIAAPAETAGDDARPPSPDAGHTTDDSHPAAQAGPDDALDTGGVAELPDRPQPVVEADEVTTGTDDASDHGNNKPTADATEITEPMEPPEDQAAATHSNDTVDNHDVAERPGALDRPTETDQATPDTEPVNDSDGPDRDTTAGAASPEAEGGTEPARTADEERIPTFEFTTDDGQLVRAYFDHDDESDEPELPGSPPDQPTGEELLEMENTERPKTDKFRRIVAESGGDALEEVHEDADTIDKLVKPLPPIGYPETKTAPDHPVVATTDHDGAGVGDMVTGLVVGGMVLGEGINRLNNKITKFRRSIHDRD